MMFRMITIATGLFLVKGSVILSPSPALAAEGEPFTWTCTYSGSETVSAFTWVLNGNTLALITSPACTPFRDPPNSSLYEYACISTSQATFTVKQISNMSNGNSWRCAVAAPGNIHSNNVTVTVQVSVSSVRLTPPTGSIKENVDTTFKCVTSTSRPEANITWYKESTTGQKQVITSEVSSTTESVVGDLKKSTSVLKYTPSRSDNTYKIYCQALNIPGRTPVTSTTFQMDVQYSPESPPYIQNYSNGSTYKVIENKQGILSCIIKGGNPLATLTWSCFNNGLSTETSGTTVTKKVTWSATRGADRSCTCQSSHPIAGTQSVSVSVTVLYKPDRPTFKVGTAVSGPINFIDGKSSSVVCESNGKPNPDSYRWNKAGSSSTAGDTLTFNPVKKQDDGQYTCSAQNTMVPSSGDTQIGSNNSTVKINVLFPPSKPTIHYSTITGQQTPGNTIAVIRDVQITFVCKSEANPKPAYTWTGQTASNASLTIKINEENQKKTCTARNTMIETQGVTQQGSSSSLLTFIMLYPPEIKDCKLQYNNGPPISVSNNIDVKELSSFTITCSVNSKPEATTSWLGPITSSNKILNVNRVNRQQNGTYTIFASNRMEPTFGGITRGNNTKSFNFNILYAPKIKTLDNQEVVAGLSVNVQCPVRKGNPESTTFKWTRNGDDKTWNTQTLYIQNVTKNDDMMYTCTVQNIMRPTGSSLETGTDSGSFHLNVLYRASITSFVVKGSQSSSVTVNEKADVTFTCIVESNPGSSIEIQLPNETLYRKESVRTLIYNHTGATCLDTGVYTCSASNSHNNGKASEKKLNLFVRCYPRPLTQIKENVTSALRVQSSFIFKGLAYPIPTFTWLKKQETTWEELSNNTRLSISITRVDTNLTIKNVSQSDYGEYQLKIENEIDVFIQNYTLIPEGVPETPSEFKVIEEHVLDTSVLLQWKPGFDGGPEQTFILMYKKTSDQKWMNKTVRDTKNNVMNYTLDNLASESEYQVVIFSQNRVGRSVGRKNITFMTNVAESEPSNGNSALIGGAAGGGAGLVLILLIVGVITLRRRGFFSKGKAYREEENSDRKPVHSAEDDYGMQDNPMYVSAGPRDQTTGGSGSSDAGAVYSTVDKERNKIGTNKNDVYAEVNKSKKTKKDLTDVYSSPVKPKGNKDKKEKKGFLKDKKNKKMTQDVDIYENATTTELKDTTAKQKKNDEIIYENPEPTKQAARKNVNKDGLIYADLTFNDQPKGQKKLVIHGLDDMTEYVQVDFTKKAEPLPDSDDENNPPK